MNIENWATLVIKRATSLHEYSPALSQGCSWFHAEIAIGTAIAAFHEPEYNSRGNHHHQRRLRPRHGSPACRTQMTWY